MKRYVGQPIPRIEDDRLLAGRGRYTDDVNLEGQAWCAFVRSPHAHAKIKRIDTTAARAAPGVLAVLTGADYAADGFKGVEHFANPVDAVDPSRKSFLDAREFPHLPLTPDIARHVGEPVAAVVAETAALARDAAELVEVDYETLPAMVSPAGKGEVCFSEAFGDGAAVGKAFSIAKHVVRREFAVNRTANCQMEPRAALGDYDKASGLHTLISGSQGVMRQQQVIGAALGLPAAKFRVVSPDVGGGFGARSYVYPEQVVVVWAARRLGRAVKWTGDRSEGFLSDYQGRDAVIRGALALDAEGRILAYDCELFAAIGAQTVSYAPMANARNIMTTVYHVPAARIHVHGVRTHTTPISPYRGAGRPEMTHALERLLDLAARKAGIERDEIRRRNIVPRASLPYRTPMGLVYQCGDFAGYMDKVLANADWAGFAARRTAAKARGMLAGIAVANFVEAPVGAPMERAELTVAGGGVDVVVGTHSSGQGHETSFAQVVADGLQVPIEKVRIRYGDTNFVSMGGGSHSDRSMRLAGTLMVQAAADVVEQGKQAAAEMLEVQAADLVFEDGAYRVAGTDRKVSILEIGKRKALRATKEFNGRIPAHPAGAAVCEVEVDPDTGVARITRYTVIDDVGQPVNPMIVEGQTHGAIAQGVGQALCEGVAWDASGQVLTGSFMDYAIPRADELPMFRTALTEDPLDNNPLRIKGGGEGGCVPATAVVVNAICDAIGAEDLPMPVTAEKIWRAVNKK